VTNQLFETKMASCLAQRVKNWGSNLAALFLVSCCHGSEHLAEALSWARHHSPTPPMQIDGHLNMHNSGKVRAMWELF
jgi:hypothetical protein